jgi:hypothetical protein
MARTHDRSRAQAAVRLRLVAMVAESIRPDTAHHVNVNVNVIVIVVVIVARAQVHHHAVWLECVAAVVARLTAAATASAAAAAAAGARPHRLAAPLKVLLVRLRHHRADARQAALQRAVVVAAGAAAGTAASAAGARARLAPAQVRLAQRLVRVGALEVDARRRQRRAVGRANGRDARRRRQRLERRPA